MQLGLYPVASQCTQHIGTTKPDHSFVIDLSWQEKWTLGWGTVAMGISSLANLIFPRVMAKAIDVGSGRTPPLYLSHRGFLGTVVLCFGLWTSLASS